MSKKPTRTQRLRYAFDNTLSRGPAALILWLVIVTAVLIVGGVAPEAGLGPREGAPRLLPPLDTMIAPGDQVMAISEDDDTVRLSALVDVPLHPEAIATARPYLRNPERTLILGWNWRASTIVRQLDAYVAPHSMLTVAATHELPSLRAAVTPCPARSAGGALGGRRSNHWPGDCFGRCAPSQHLHPLRAVRCDALDKFFSDRMTAPVMDYSA